MNKVSSFLWKLFVFARFKGSYFIFRMLLLCWCCTEWSIWHSVVSPLLCRWTSLGGAGRKPVTYGFVFHSCKWLILCHVIFVLRHYHQSHDINYLTVYVSCSYWIALFTALLRTVHTAALKKSWRWAYLKLGVFWRARHQQPITWISRPRHTKQKSPK